MNPAGISWRFWRIDAGNGPRWLPDSCRLTSGIRPLAIPHWRMPSWIGLFMTPIKSISKANPCGNGKPRSNATQKRKIPLKRTHQGKRGGKKQDDPVVCNSSRPTGSFRCTRPPVARRLSTTMNVSYHEACPALRTPQGWPESLGTGGRFPSEQPAEFIGMRTGSSSV